MGLYLTVPRRESEGAVTEAAALAKDLAAVGVAGVMITWADNNGIPRARVVPVEGLPDAAERGVGVTTLFAVFDTHDAITFAHPGLSTPSGDVRLPGQPGQSLDHREQPDVAREWTGPGGRR